MCAPALNRLVRLPHFNKPTVKTVILTRVILSSALLIHLLTILHPPRLSQWPIWKERLPQGPVADQAQVRKVVLFLHEVHTGMGVLSRGDTSLLSGAASPQALSSVLSQEGRVIH